MTQNIKGFSPLYDDKKDANTMYFSKTKTDSNTDTSYRKVELIIEECQSYLSDKNKEDASNPLDFSIINDVTLYQSQGGQQKIHCWLMESNEGKSIKALYLSRRTQKGVYGSQEIVLSVEGIVALREFLSHLILINTNEQTQVIIDTKCNDSTFGKEIITEQEFMRLIQTNIKSTDDFYTLLAIQKMEIALVRLEQIIAGKYKNEVDIQNFLKQNIWMFGNDYTFIVENGAINTKNILDMIPQTFENYIDIIEVKLPKEKLFRYDESHKNYYSSSQLTKAIAQTQNYIFELEKRTSDKDYQQKNNCYVTRPKGIILFGSDEILSVEESQYLRILNSSYHNLQIITYQQLLEKARNTLRISKLNNDTL